MIKSGECASLREASTANLVNELAKREGVKELCCADPSYRYIASVFKPGQTEVTDVPEVVNDNGPARILVVID